MKRLIAVVVVTFAAVATLAWAVVRQKTDGPISVTAQFEDAIGLYEGNGVSVLGLPVGEVTRITARGGFVDVTILIDQDVDIPADVQAVTVSTSILTDRHIELTPPYRGGPRLENGDVIGLGRTRTPVEFDKTLGMVDKLVVALGGDGQGQGPLADLLEVGDSIATRSGTDLKETLDRLAQALRLSSDDGVATKEDIRAIVKNVAELTDAAADNDNAIREFGSNLRQLSEIMAAQDLGSGETGRRVNEILELTTQLLENNRDTLKDTLGDAYQLTTTLSDNQRELAETLNVTPLMVDNLYNAIDSNAGSLRMHILADKLLVNGQFTKEVCNLLQLKQLNCATGTLMDYGPDFGLVSMLELLTTMGDK